MSADRKYIVSYETQNYANNFPYSEIERLKECWNIADIKEIWTMVFYVECHKWSEDDLIKSLRADQVLYAEDWDNYFKELE